ncbi:unnamed protein product [Closterium sp. NIES-54]
MATLSILTFDHEGLEDLITHLRTSDTRYRAALKTEFLDKNPPPMYITLYFIVTRLPESLSRSTSSSPPSDESVEPNGQYPELVGGLVYLMTCTRPDLAYPLSILARYVAPGRHRPEHWEAAKGVVHYLCSTSGMGLVLGGRGLVVLTGHADASWVDDLATRRSPLGYTFSLGSGSVSWWSTRLSSVLSSSCEAEIYAGDMAAQDLRCLTYLLTDLGERPRSPPVLCEAEIYAGDMAAQDLRCLTYLLTDLGERPRSPPVLYVDNKAMIALCQEHRLEHRTKHIALRYFLARELQQRGQLRLAYVATRANTADIFTNSVPPSDHQRFSILLGLGLKPDQRLPPDVVSLPPNVPPAPHLEECVARTARRREAEQRGANGESPGWARPADCCKCDPQPPWVRGAEAENLAKTRVAQRDIWERQFPPGDCQGQRLLVLPWSTQDMRGVGSGSVIEQTKQYPSWQFHYSTNPRLPHGANDTRAYEFMQDVAVSLASVLIAAECDYFVGSLESNWSRLINELRSTNGRLYAGFIALNIGL